MPLNPSQVSTFLLLYTTHRLVPLCTPALLCRAKQGRGHKSCNKSHLLIFSVLYKDFSLLFCQV
ncbi:hypothetical protein PROFUN_03461 [Planoprotostelium fungivorum]|uniref:Uncharacterized protein n=1 Tax=Planoprotostelium fungivorum TaxID=1890364 RepID=A0A2P6MN74_9EUKA|nr:hypothetical protein PROFUN_03461 [Planoprotostelium fungivorum]